MKKRWLCLTGCLLAGSIGLHAQEVRKADSTFLRPHPLPLLRSPFEAPRVSQPALIGLPDPLETKEQRAQRINRETVRRVMSSLRIPSFQVRFKQPLLMGPYTFVQGTRPVMNANNPFIFSVEPCGEPVIHPYSSKTFPQCVRLEYDFKSGTYKEVMVKWDEVQNQLAP